MERERDFLFKCFNYGQQTTVVWDYEDARLNTAAVSRAILPLHGLSSPPTPVGPPRPGTGNLPPTRPLVDYEQPYLTSPAAMYATTAGPLLHAVGGFCSSTYALTHCTWDVHIQRIHSLTTACYRALGSYCKMSGGRSQMADPHTIVHHYGVMPCTP